MKGIRRSLNKGSIGAPVPTYSSLPTSNFPSLAPIQSQSSSRPQNSPAPAPPKRVIRATESYRARSDQELSFEQGDFFHVVSDDGGDDWFDAANPMTGQKGLVPARSFQVLGRNVRETAQGMAGKNGGGTPSGSHNGQQQYQQQSQQSQQPQQQQRQQQQQQSSSSASNYQARSQSQQGYAPPSSSVPSSYATSPPATSSGLPAPTPKSQPLYGIVQYDFVAERADELDAKRGEPIIVIAQSNHEWFVAKPIGRLGGPGLIPVAFVEIQDMTTGKPVENVEELIRSAVVPKVEEWKKMTADYKSASIPLGRFDFAQPGGPQSTGPPGRTSEYGGGSNLPATTQSGGRVSSQYQENKYPSNPSRDDRQSQYRQPADENYSQDHPQQQQQAKDLPEPDSGYSYDRERRQYGLVTAASVESFHQEEGSFWFHLRAQFSTGASLILYRLYQDFYDFQIALMDEFPVEAGRIPPGGEGSGRQVERILPMMPGPTDFEDETVCAQRVFDLSVYLDDLCRLPERLRAAGLMYEFFATRAGDVAVAEGDGKGDLHMKGITGISNGNGGGGGTGSIEGQYGELVEYLDQMDGRDSRSEGVRTSGNVRGNDDTLGMERLGMGTGRDQEEYERSGSRQQDRSNSGYSERDQYAYPAPQQQQQQSSSHQRQPSYQSTYPSPAVTSPTPSYPVSTPTTATSTSATVPFVKIKIFHRNTDDLIAIRVPPTVSHASLVEKVRERLGGDVVHLRYREEVGNGSATSPSGSVVMAGGASLIGVDNDEDLGRWIRSGARLVLYAD